MKFISVSLSTVCCYSVSQNIDINETALRLTEKMVLNDDDVKKQVWVYYFGP